MYDVRKIIGRDSLHKLEKLKIQPKIGEYSLARIDSLGSSADGGKLSNLTDNYVINLVGEDVICLTQSPLCCLIIGVISG